MLPSEHATLRKALEIAQRQADVYAAVEDMEAAERWQRAHTSLSLAYTWQCNREAAREQSATR